MLERWCRRVTASNRARLAVLGVLVALGGCASSPPARDGSSSAIPERAYYVGLYSADASHGELEPLEDYLLWVARFYQGWGPFPFGWQAMSEAALLDTPPDRQVAVAQALAELGRLISGEWAKSRKRTRISNRALSVWARAMNEAIERGEVESLVERATADVEALLAGELDSGAIRFERYYPGARLEA